MSATFWNMRRRLRAQKQTDKIITDIAGAQAAEKKETEKKSAKKGGTKNDKATV